MRIGHNPVLRNVARSKPASQISILTDISGSHAASLANDGSRNRSYAVCAVSKVETNPWWAVDLIKETVVCLVKLTNVRDTNRGILIADLICVTLIILLKKLIHRRYLEQTSHRRSRFPAASYDFSLRRSHSDLTL